MKKLEISRKEWLRGGPSRESCLYRPEDGKMCCLGFLGRAHGLSNEDMEHRLYPSSVEDYRESGPQKLFEHHEQRNNWPLYPQKPEPWEETLGMINDFPGVDDETREAWVKEGFRTLLGYDVTFVD